jgi:hypothetical protein
MTGQGLGWGAWLVVALVGCSAAPAASTPPSASSEPAATTPAATSSGAFAQPLPAGTRVVAVGDVHGDADRLRLVLRAAGLIDASNAWSGGRDILVQTGDQLDRGDQERDVLDSLARWGREAAAVGGAVHVLVGNHEVMNTAGDLRYVTPGGFAAFADVPGEVPGAPEAQRGRVAAFRPGGPYAALLADHPVVLQLGPVLFVHGGLHPEHVAYGVDRINAEARAWFAGRGSKPAVLDGPLAPVWSRRYSEDPPDCGALSSTLGALGAATMVVGHTVQEGGIASACGGAVWRIDAGLARHYGGPAQAWVWENGQARVITADAPR